MVTFGDLRRRSRTISEMYPRNRLRNTGTYVTPLALNDAYAASTKRKTKTGDLAYALLKGPSITSGEAGSTRELTAWTGTCRECRGCDIRIKSVSEES